MLASHLADGRLIRVLADWCPPFSATTCITRHQLTRAIAVLVAALRYRG